MNAHPVVALSDSRDMSEVSKELQKTVQEGLWQIQAGLSKKGPAA